jgi:hypothetical protein
VLQVIAITPGSTVSFSNSDAIMHNVFSPRQSSGGFDLGTYPQSERRSFTFQEEGAHVILCHVHPEMVAYVVTVDSPYRAVSDSAGRFRIEGVAAGTYRIRTWHRRLRTFERLVVVPENGDVRLDLSLAYGSPSPGSTQRPDRMTPPSPPHLLYAAAFLVDPSVARANRIPAFARQYRTACSTCHTAAPKLNVLGESFRLNGYRFPDDGALVKRDTGIPLGDEAWKDLWPRAIWPGEIPAIPPIAVGQQTDANVRRGSAKTSGSPSFRARCHCSPPHARRGISVFVEMEGARRRTRRKVRQEWDSRIHSRLHAAP